MPETTKLQRWLDLIAHLVAHHFPLSAEQIMEALPGYVGPTQSDDKTTLESSRKTFERDKAELRKLGIPIETVQFAVGGEDATEGYRLKRKDFYLPYLRLLDRAGEPPPPSTKGPDEFLLSTAELDDAVDGLNRVAEMTNFPLAREARFALRKLTFDSPRRDQPSSPRLWIDPPEAAALRQCVAFLSEAVLQRKRVRFRYRGIYRGEETARDVAGYGMLFRRGYWYLIGHDALRDAVRIFRVDRMIEPKPDAKKPGEHDYDVPQTFDISAWRNREPWELGDDPPLQSLVRFRFPRSLWADRNDHGRLVADEGERGAMRAFDVHQVEPFLRWILSQEDEAEILEPSELARALRELAREAANLYRRGA